MYLVTLVNAVNHVILLIHCALVVSMLMNAVIEVMLVNANHVAVHDCFMSLLYSGNSISECHIAVLWWLISWQVLYSGSHVSEYGQSHCSTHLLYSGSLVCWRMLYTRDHIGEYC